MEFTESLKKNHEFRRLYNKGKSAVTPCFAVYCRPNGGKRNRLGITVSGKIGNAVVRNRVRRRLREIYRLNEGRFRRGFDLVAVARMKSVSADYARLERDFLGACAALGVLGEGGAG